MSFEKNGSKNVNKYSNLNIGGVMMDAHNIKLNALDVNNINSLIPERYKKISWDLKDMGDGTMEVEYLYFHGFGEKEKNQVEIGENPLGIKEKTTVSFLNKTPEALEGTYFTIYDDSGSVGVWYSLDGLTVEPVTSNDRNIEIPLLTGDTDIDIADETSIILHTDSKFSSIASDTLILVESSTVGVRIDATPETSNLPVTIATQGVDSFNGKYFLIFNGSNDQYHVWFNINNTGVEPVVPNSIGLEVPLTLAETQTTVAEKTAIQINLNNDFNSENDGLFVIVQNTSDGGSDGITNGDLTFAVDNIEQGVTSQLVGTIRVFFDDDNIITGFERV